MAIVNNWDSIEAFQLKECYELAAQYETNDAAQSVLREKAKKIDIPMNYVPVQADASYQESTMQIVSEAMYGLSLEGFSASENSGFKYSHKINSLPGSGEKEFVLALLSLRNGTNETHRIEALGHISSALGYSPNDPRYITLARVLQDADK